MSKTKLTSVGVSLNFPGLGGVTGTWEADESEQLAAWEMYVELVTRTATVEDEEGLLRETLTSLYSIFDTTRSILKRYGPGIAQPKGEGRLSFGYIAVAILNEVLRPILSTWHPRLSVYESDGAGAAPSLEREQAWEHYQELKAELRKAQATLQEYANLLAEAAGVPPLTGDQEHYE